MAVILETVSKSENENKVRNILDRMVDTAIQESRLRVIVQDGGTAEDVGEQVHLQGDPCGGVKSYLEEIVVDNMLHDIVQGNIEAYDQGVANMMEIEEVEFDDMDWSQEYDWAQGEGQADILARMEISACMMDTTEQEWTMCMMRERMGKGEEDVDMGEGDAKDAREADDEIFQGECIQSIHCEGSQGWLWGWQGRTPGAG
jgi:hypothetical protein